MKNRFLVMLMAGMALFSACNDDDDDKNPLEGLNGTYAAGTERDLDLKYSDALFLGKSVEFTAADNQTANLKLLGVVPGEAETTFSGVALGGDATAYTFTAEDKTVARTVTLSGSVTKGLLTTNVDVAFADHALMGKWILDPTSPIRFEWEAEEGTAITIDLGGSEPLVLTPAQVAPMVQAILPALLKGYLQDVSFLQDGNISATYNAAQATDENADPDPLWQASPLNLAHYRVADTVCSVYPNIEMIMYQVEQDQAGRTDSDISGILNQLLAAGVPVHFTAVKNGATTVSIDLEFVNQLTALLPLVSTLIPSDNEMAALILPVLEQLPDVLAKTTKLKIGLNLVAAE